MGKLTVTTNAKVKPEDLPAVENPVSTDPLSEKPGAPQAHFVVPQPVPTAPPMYRPPCRRTSGCSSKCKGAVAGAVVLLLVVALVTTGVLLLKAHRRVEKPPCRRTSGERHASHEREGDEERHEFDEDDDCDEEKNEKWWDWLDACMNEWFARHPEGEGRPPKPHGLGSKEDGGRSSDRREPDK